MVTSWKLWKRRECGSEAQSCVSMTIVLVTSDCGLSGLCAMDIHVMFTLTAIRNRLRRPRHWSLIWPSCHWTTVTLYWLDC